MKSWARHSGFTIVELLVVIVVIAILAGIVLVSYEGVRGNAYDAAVQSDLNASAKLISIQAGHNTGQYPSSNNGTGDPNGIGVMHLGLSTENYMVPPGIINNFAYCANSNRSEFAIGGLSKSGKAFMYSSTTGKVEEFKGTWANSIMANCKVMMASPSIAQWGYNGGNGSGWQQWTQSAN